MLENLDADPGSLDQYDQLLRRDSSLTTLQFFQTVLPQDSIHYLVLFTKKLDERGSPFKIHKPFSDLETMAAAVAEFDNDEQYIGVYHACAGYLKPFIELDELNKWGKPKRQFRVGDNWHQAKAFWVDIDCGEEKHAKGEGYLTKRDACTALYKFADTIAWPRPMVVDSGNGIHAYWPLTKDIAHEKWVKVAAGLKATLRHFGVLADPSRTADFASILRPVGGTNRKNGGAKLVTVVNGGTPSGPDVLAFALNAFIVMHGVGRVKAETDQKPSSGLNDDLISHLKSAEGQESIDVVRSALSYLDPGMSRDQWRTMVWAIRHGLGDTPEALELADKWSKGGIRA